MIKSITDKMFYVLHNLFTTIISMYVLIMSHTLFRVNPHYICLNVKELVAQSKRKIWSLVHERTLNHLAKMAKWLSCVVSTYQINTHNKVSLAKWLSVCLWTNWLWVRVQLPSLKLWSVFQYHPTKKEISFKTN